MPKKIDLINKRFGELLVVSQAEIYKHQMAEAISLGIVFVLVVIP